MQPTEIELIAAELKELKRAKQDREALENDFIGPAREYRVKEADLEESACSMHGRYYYQWIDRGCPACRFELAQEAKQ